ncbi:MAG: asparagine synthase (glutamine-hydrolyzing) [Acetobacteraceae bacterium]|nr:asparagine synthase (glutamine-hydrolyzing) [Acetobacteraceae bacterium]
MCGITGILISSRVNDPRPLSAINVMTDALLHRGPDDSGIWTDRQAGIALGHRRLAVVDLSEAGHEPMVSHSEHLVMTYNGEVYNFAGLRSELEDAGYRFRGHCDAEVMLAAFEEFGVERALDRFAGMFAFALWDRREHVLHLVRDRIGKKPLYVALVNGALLFASELKAIRAFPGFQPRIDKQALAMVLRHGWVPDQYCIWEGVFKLPPGSILSIRPESLATTDAGQLRAQARRWWSLAEVAEAGQRDPLQLEPSALEEELDQLLRLTVGERMLADVPLGAFLSGGIDSSVIVALMQALSNRPVRTFTIGFDEAGFDEAGGAASVARHLGTDHTEFRVTPREAQAVIPELPRIWDEPFADESQIPTLLVSRLARQHVTVALSGDGGDESFGGYARHFLPVQFASMFGLPLSLRRPAASALRAVSPDIMRGILQMLPLPGAMRGALRNGNLQKLGRIFDAADDRDLYHRLTTLSSDLHPGNGPGAHVMPPLPDLLGRLIYRDMTGYLPDNILVKVDRASMAVALEARCPLLDHRVIEFAWRSPSSVKVRDGKGKWLLRQVLKRYVPEALFERPKHGFNVPIGVWLRGPLRDWAEHLLAESRLRQEGFVDAARVRGWWQQHLSGRRDRAYELWAVLMVEAWLDAMRNPIRPSPAARLGDLSNAGLGGGTQSFRAVAVS